MVEYSQRWPPPVRRLTSLLWHRRGNEPNTPKPMIIRGVPVEGRGGWLIEMIETIYRLKLDEKPQASSLVTRDEEVWVGTILMPPGDSGWGIIRHFQVIRKEGTFTFRNHHYTEVLYNGSPEGFRTGSSEFYPVRNGLHFIIKDEDKEPGVRSYTIPIKWELVWIDPREKMLELPDF